MGSFIKINKYRQVPVKAADEITLICSAYFIKNPERRV